MIRVVTCLGDAKNKSTHSGVAYHLWFYGKQRGFIQDAWQVFPEQLRGERFYWNLWQLIRQRKYGGFQYSLNCLSALFEQIPRGLREAEVISLFPLFPMERNVFESVSFYIDATIGQCLEDPFSAPRIPNQFREEILQREREQFAAARFVVCRSFWTASHLVDECGVNMEKVHIIPGGANIDEAALPLDLNVVPVKLNPIRLGFLGKDWRRKNLELVLRIAELLKSRGHQVQVLAAGFAPNKGPSHPLLKSVGFLDKSRDMAGFIEFVRSVHFGCLFSFFEPFGLSNVEFIRLGVPVLTWDVGGISDTVPAGLGKVFNKEHDVFFIAEIIESYIKEPDAYYELRREVALRAREVSWPIAIERFVSVWGGSRTCSLDIRKEKHQ